MTGKELKEKILNNGYSLVDIANKLGITPQALNSRIYAKSIKLEFVQKINSIIGEIELLNNKENTSDTVSMSREVFEQISRLTETVLSQQNTIASLQREKEKADARQDDHVASVDVKNSNVG